MLVEFSVQNFRSIKEKVTLSMVASPDKAHPNNIFTDPSGKMRLLKTAAIYGANASGKSNVLKAMKVMGDTILKSNYRNTGDRIDEIVPFRLDESTINQPSEFEAMFIIGDYRYVYGFAADTQRIHEEWLTRAKMSASRVVSSTLFSRRLDENGEYKLKLNNAFNSDYTALARQTNSNRLLLSKFADNNHSLSQQIWLWFNSRFNYMPGTTNHFLAPFDTAEMYESEKDPDFKKIIRQLISNADVGVQDIEVITESFIGSPEWEKLSDEQKKRIIDEVNNKGEVYYSRRVVTKHVLPDQTSVNFDLQRDESSGTQTLFALAGPLVYSVLNDYGLFLDELDSSLHPHILQQLIKLIHSETGSAMQLVFTTHDTALLDSDLFRRDQIWFTEKDNCHSTDLYSLWDIDLKPRKNQNYRQGYLNGRYGAIPVLGDFSFWQKEDKEENSPVQEDEIKDLKESSYT